MRYEKHESFVDLKTLITLYFEFFIQYKLLIYRAIPTYREYLRYQQFLVHFIKSHWSVLLKLSLPFFMNTKRSAAMENKKQKNYLAFF